MDAADQFLAACRASGSATKQAGIRQTWNGFVQAARQSDEALLKVATTLPALAPESAGWAAIAIGAVIEARGDARISAPFVIGLLQDWISELPQQQTDADANDESGSPPSLPVLDARQDAIAANLAQLCQASVAHLARLEDMRAELRQTEGLLDRLLELQVYSHGPRWVHEALIRESGTMLVLATAERKGFRVRYRNVGTCFHFFTLLQQALAEQLAVGRAVDPSVIEIAQGEYSANASDSAWWHYGSARSNTPNPVASIWGEAPVSQIDEVNGERVMLLWPPIFKGRSWDAGFFGPQLAAMPPSVSIDEALTQESCEAWFATLRIDPVNPASHVPTQAG